MQQVPFSLVWRHTAYCWSEIENFKECADGIEPKHLHDRYVEFLDAFSSKRIKKNTMVDIDVLDMFILDLENRAQIDYIEDHWDDDPEIQRGGKRFLDRATKLRKIHREALHQHHTEEAA